VATDIVARFDHNWKVVGMSRAIDACPGLKYSELLREELRYQLGSLDVFGRVPLEEIPEPRTVYRAAARIDARAIDPEPQPEPLFPADVRGMGLARAVNGKALNEIIGLCGERIAVHHEDVPAQIARLAGRFTDVVTGDVASMCCTEMPGRAGEIRVLDLGGMMDGLGGTPSMRVHGMPLRIDRKIGSWVAFCVNRRNMAIGLGDGRFSYDRERERLHMSVKFAFDVSRAARGVMLDFGRELDPEYRPGGPVRRRQLR